MKKAITILAVLIVLVGAVFAGKPADETQRITITSVVQRVDPQYLLKGVLGAEAANFSTNGKVVADGEHNGNTLAGGDISQANVVASFGLFQVEDAKNRFGYDFTITATSLVQTKDGAGDDVDSQDAYTTATAPKFSALGDTNWYDPEVVGISAATASLNQSTGVTASVTFDGLAKIDKNPTTPKLTFTVTWDADREAPAGTYMADVTMAYTVR